ncbi:MAG: hypothetical protein KF819_22360 [Labilithrix sp.]|nr:hypothetical protein [Labilithrix sp.]
MESRIVVSFRAPGGPGRTFLERARALDARASASGGMLIAWDANRTAFLFDGDRLEDAIKVATSRGGDTIDDELPWRVGIAEGDLKPLAEDGTRGPLAWGAPLVAAAVLASAAKPGEILCAQTMRALRSGDLVAAGTRIGRDGSLRVRGVRLDPVHPWRRQAVEQLARMRVAPLVGMRAPKIDVRSGSLVVLRADPGTGGTRWLTELASGASRALVVSPSGSSFEPLGALRRALARSLTRELSPLLLELAPSLDALLAGKGATLEVATKLITAFLWPKTEGQPPGLLLIDDAKAVDPSTLEACVRAARSPGAAFGVVARADATSGLPSLLAALPKTAEIDLAPLTRDAAEALAGGCTNEALDAMARKRWARLAANVPLGIVESVAYGIVTGDIAWSGDKASPRSRASGRGKVRGGAEWINLRAREESEHCRALLCLVALLGGEARVTRLANILERSGHAMDVDMVLAELMCTRWLTDTQEDWVGLPSRTHRDALVGLLDDAAKKPIHRAAAEVIEREEGVFGKVEAAWHAAQGEDGARASRMALAAAKSTADGLLEASTTQLIAFARRADPSCEEAALALLANALARSPSAPPPRSRTGPPPSSGYSAPPPAKSVPPEAAVAPPAPAVPSFFDEELAVFEIEVHDSEPPTIAKLELAPMEANGGPAAPAEASFDASAPASSPDLPNAGEPSVAGANIATRLGELAKEALLSADNAALERWVDGLRAAGESPLFTERLRALSRLGRGDIGDALRVLRRTRSSLDPQDHKLRCQTSLALGVALSVAGRSQEALLEGMDALARARHASDERGAEACLAFLSKLYASVGREESGALRRPART